MSRRHAAWASMVWLVLPGCAAEPLDAEEIKRVEYADAQSSAEPLSSTERRYMYFEGSCHFLACCAKRNCGLRDAAVSGACGGACSNSTPWIARPNRNSAYRCGSCVRVCLEGSTTCVDAAVWDNSITASGIEGNVAVFEALGLAYTESASSCSGSGGARVTVGPCTGAVPEPLPEEPAAEPAPADPAPEEPMPEPTPEPGPESSDCSCGAGCDYCWCGTSHEGVCSDAWFGTGDGCDCGCPWADPDCTSGGSGGGTGTGATGGAFAGVYCTTRGSGCGGNTPCWPAEDCPTGSTCDWSEASWGRCVR